ncbi:MAG: HutP family protein, partial [Clostridia bacterium]|nr:HutP family protein [Clostridia bacterium]
MVESKKVAAAAMKMALTENMEEENVLKAVLLKQGIHAAAVNYGGDSLVSVTKILERSVVAAKREGVIRDVHSDEGAVAGAAH